MMQSEAWEVMGDLMRTAFGTPGYRLLHSNLPQLSVTLKELTWLSLSVARPKRVSTMVASLPSLVARKSISYRQDHDFLLWHIPPLPHASRIHLAQHPGVGKSH